MTDAMPNDPPSDDPVTRAPASADGAPVEQVFELDNFRGPMDLLLHLVREQEVAIEDVDLAQLCDQFLAVVAQMEAVDIDVAGEFMVMASTLMLIKSRAILPREEVDLAEEIDPADELIAQLLEYRRFKTLSMALGRMAVERSRRFPRGGNELPAVGERELAEIGLWDLVGSYARLAEELDLDRRFDALTTQRPLREFMRDVLGELGRHESRSFRDLVHSAGGRSEIFAVFLALLELVKSMQVEVLQEHSRGEIEVRLRQGRDESLLADVLAHDSGASDRHGQGDGPERLESMNPAGSTAGTTVEAADEPGS